MDSNDGFAYSGSASETMQADDMQMIEEEAEYNEQGFSKQTQDTAVPIDRKIIKNADLRFQVQELEASTQRIQNVVKGHDGYISSMNQSNSNYSFDNRLQIKVPADKFEALLTALESESIYTDHKNIFSNDVTEEFTDINIRLKTKKDVRDRYIDILRTKAKTVNDILNAEEKIRRIQEEIESMEGRLKYLNSRVSYSTISLSIYQRVEGKVRRDIYSKSFFTKVKESFADGGSLFVEILLLLVRLWPLIILAFILYFLRGRIGGLWRRKKNN